MDNLVLIRVAADLNAAFGHSLLREVREETPERFRLILQAEDRSGSIVVSLLPARPWIGRPAGRWEGPRRPPGPFAARCAKSLGGVALRQIEKLGSDRVVAIRFADGSALVAELAAHAANLVLLDREGGAIATARRPRAAQARMAAGQPYRPPFLPAGRLDPFQSSPEEIDRFLKEESRREGKGVPEVLKRRVFGVGTEGEALIWAESMHDGATPGSVLHRRLRGLLEGALAPVVEAPGDDLLERAETGTLEPAEIHLLPWEYGEPAEGRMRIRREDAAATAGLYYDCLERAAIVRGRGEALRAILSGEIERTRSASRRVESDLEGMTDPDRYRRWGEAILAGLSVARRAGDHAIVPDPYDATGGEIIVPAPAAQTLPAVAEDHFRRHRKVRRGRESARGRLESLRERSGRLEAIAARFAGAVSASAGAGLAEAMRAEGLAVGLEPATRAGRTAARGSPPRLEGVRLYTSTEGVEILVGRTGKENDRLTFRLAAPDDFWLHAAGTPGAHVIVRNPARQPRPSRATLSEAAALAAWWSDARNDSGVDVQWTRRKHVHRLRGAAPGTVTVKKFESVRVRPAIPAGVAGDSGV